MIEARNIFPEGVQKIAQYLIYFIDNKENNFELSEKIFKIPEFNEYLEKNNKKLVDLVIEICSDCEKEIKEIVLKRLSKMEPKQMLNVEEVRKDFPILNEKVHGKDLV